MRAIGLLLVLVACGSGSSGDWVAEIDGVKLPVAELAQSIERRLEDAPDAQRDDVVTEELNRLVSQQVALNHAASRGVTVTESEISARLLALHGEAWKDPDPRYREEVRRQMIVDRVALLELAPRARVPESELVAYYEEHREEYDEPERAQIRQIVVPERDRAEALRAELEAGADFATLARENSIAPEAAQGGALPPFARGELPEAFDRAFELEPGRVSPVIESPYGFHLFRLEARLPAREPELDELRDRLELELGQRHLEDLRREWLRTLRKNAQITLNEDLLETLR